MQLVYGENIDINKADIFTMKNEYSYAAFMGVLSTLYMKAHVSNSFRTEPYNAVLIISKSMTKPFRQQPESSLDRIQAIVSRMVEPDGGINFSIFVAESTQFATDAKIGLKHSVSQCWPLKNNGQSKLITGNAPPSNINNGENNE